MTLSGERMFWISFSFIWICSVSQFPVDVLAQEYQYSSNPDDYDFGWFTSGAYAPESVPTCSYCVNAILNQTTHSLDALDRRVGMYRCDGVQVNEMWAYHEPTTAIVFSNLTAHVLCVDAVPETPVEVLRLRRCNSSSPTQRWTLDGNRVMSSTVGSNGTRMFLVASIPDKERNPYSQAYDYPLNRSSYIYPPGLNYTYTDQFTFLSKKNLVDRSTNKFNTKGLLKITNSPLNYIFNGGFENTTIQAGRTITWSDWVQETPSYFALCGWVIDSGPIDYVTEAVVETVSGGGSASVHLNTYSDAAHWGSISQTVNTEAGKEYNLSFVFRGFPPNVVIPVRPTWNCSRARPYTEARLQLQVSNATTDPASSVADGSGLARNFTIDANEEWQNQSVTFTAFTDVTVISFTSLNVNESCGPLIDAVQLSLSPEQVSRASGKRDIPVTWMLVTSIGGMVLLALI